MATTIAGSVRVNVNVTSTKTQALGNDVDRLEYTLNKLLADGTGADKAQIIARGTATLAASATESIDLGALACGQGTGTMTKVKYLIIGCSTATPGVKLKVGGNANALVNYVDNASDKIVIGAGGLLLLSSPVDGFVVTASTADILDVTNAGSVGATFVWALVGEGSLA